MRGILLGVPEHQNDRVPSQEHFADEAVPVYWPPALGASPALGDLQDSTAQHARAGVVGRETHDTITTLDFVSTNHAHAYIPIQQQSMHRALMTCTSA